MLKRHFKAILLLRETKYQSIDSRFYIFEGFGVSKVALMHVSTDQLKYGSKYSSGNRQTYFRRVLINHLRKELNLLIMVAIEETLLKMKVSVSIRDSSIHLTTTKKAATIYYSLG